MTTHMAPPPAPAPAPAASVAAVAAGGLAAVAATWTSGLLAPVPALTPVRRSLAIGAIGASLLLVAAGGVLSMPKTVDEDVPVAGQAGATLVASGELTSLAHPTAGTVEVVDTGEGRELVLSGFETDPGPDLRVVLVAGAPASDGDVRDIVDLGALKGNAGTQSYPIPDGVDITAYDTAYVWCRAFTAGFGSARLA